MARRTARNIQRRAKRNDEFAAFGEAMAHAVRDRRETADDYEHAVRDLELTVRSTWECHEAERRAIGDAVKRGERSRRALARDIERGAVARCDEMHPPPKGAAARRDAARSLLDSYDLERKFPGVEFKANTGRVPLDAEEFTIPGGLRLRIEQQATGTQWRHVWVYAPIARTDAEEAVRYLRIALARRIVADAAHRIAAPGGKVEVIDVQNGGAVQWAADRHIVRHLSNRQIASLIASIARALTHASPKANTRRAKPPRRRRR